jgi:hypothetical protein
MLLMFYAAPALSQETVFNVPSADVLDPGGVYFEFDATYMPRSAARSFTPRTVVGIGRQIEIGLNINGLSAPGEPRATLTPTIKWKAYDGRKNGWAFLIGDDLFIPVQNRSYRVGNYTYAECTKTWRTNTRATFGAYAFTKHVVASGNRAGGQFAIEQPMTKRLTLAADWYTGDQDLGYVSPGIIFKATSRLTLYGTYQIGNGRASVGNHQMLIELGWNFF